MRLLLAAGPQLAEHGRCYEPTIVDVALMRSLRIDDPRVIALDPSLSKRLAADDGGAGQDT